MPRQQQRVVILDEGPDALFGYRIESTALAPLGKRGDRVAVGEGATPQQIEDQVAEQRGIRKSKRKTAHVRALTHFESGGRV